LIPVTQINILKNKEEIMKAAGTILVLLALLIGIVPQFTDCQSQGRALQLANGKTVAMKCHWTAQAELVVAAPMLLIGAMMFRAKRKEILRNLSILGILTGVLAIALPTVLIGVCASDEMMCNVAMKPVLLLTGTLAAVDSAAVLFMATRQTPAEQAVEVGA